MQVSLAYYHGDLVGIDVCEILQTCAGSAVLSVLLRGGVISAMAWTPGSKLPANAIYRPLRSEH